MPLYWQNITIGVSLETKVAEQRDLLDKLIGIGDRGSLAVDFGCGSGFQSLALSDLGYDVLAIDTSEHLLRILGERSDSRRIDAKCLDLLEVEMVVVPGSVDLAVCMGDTISHLPNREAVRGLIRSVHRILKSSGRFAVTYRNLAANELQGLDRVIPVRSDDERIMTCFLEYSTPDTVTVNDLIHVRGANGVWTLRKSSYQKLRLPIAWLSSEMEFAGLSVTKQEAGRMATIVATKRES